MKKALALTIALCLLAPALAADGKVNLNTATLEDLMTLRGIGEKKAEAIIDYRQHYQGEGKAFKRIEDIKKVWGIGRKTFEANRHLLTV